ncbi:MAG: uroporphyrinogen decarboxylase [bacterium]|nr:uroporphyrinogen decarboxylase [bacterium]MBU1916714.1 uroporphyrinogen decarboxylase [bacterium]
MTMSAKERFLNACMAKEVDRPPVWMMRQAGRYLPEYQSLKSKNTTKKMMTTPDIASDITIQPVNILGVDAAILYSDILILPDVMGMNLSFVSGEGPLFDFRIESCDDLNKLNTTKLKKELGFVYNTIKLCLNKLPKNYPLIGFAGAPFTVACYMISGGHKKDLSQVKTFAWTQPKVFHELMALLTKATIEHLTEQYKSGVAAVQLFDTWAGILSCEDYCQLVKPYSMEIFTALQQAYIPSIHYIKEGSHLLRDIVDLPSDAIGVDWKASLADVHALLKGQHAIQGNFDPDILLTTPQIIEKRLSEMLKTIPNPHKGYIINLGHGIKPQTPVKNAKVFVEKAKTFFK